MRLKCLFREDPSRLIEYSNSQIYSLTSTFCRFDTPAHCETRAACCLRKPYKCNVVQGNRRVLIWHFTDDKNGAPGGHFRYAFDNQRHSLPCLLIGPFRPRRNIDVRSSVRLTPANTPLDKPSGSRGAIRAPLTTDRTRDLRVAARVDRGGRSRPCRSRSPRAA